MGTWGAGAFENDDALDWLGDLSAGEGWAPVSDALEQIDLGEPPAPSCTRALAAAELVAAARGHPTKDFPESAAQWLATAGTPPSPELVAQAAAAVAAIRRTSELRELFKEAGDLRAWSAEMRRLDARLKKAPRAVPTGPVAAPSEDLFKRANREIKAARWEDAIVTLTRILEADPDRVVSLNNRAWCLAHAGRLAEASADIERAMDAMQRVMWPQFMKAKCYGTRGFILLREGNHRAAIDDYTVSLDIVPHSGNFEQRAEAYDAIGEHALAASDRRSARMVQITVSLRRARVAWHDDRHREALTELNRVLELEPAHATALFRRAMVLWELKLMEEAERDLSQVIELRPEDRYLYLRRSEVRAIRGEREGARRDRERCHELGLDLIGHYDEGLERQRQDIARGNATLVQRAVIPELTFLLKLIPEHVRARELRAQAFESVGNGRRAAQDRKMAQRLEPLPTPTPAPDDTPFGRWFWDMMDRDP